MLIADPNLSVGNILLCNLTTRASGIMPTKRSLKVAELNQRHWRIGLAAPMPSLTDQVR